MSMTKVLPVQLSKWANMRSLSPSCIDRKTGLHKSHLLVDEISWEPQGDNPGQYKTKNPQSLWESYGLLDSPE
jgi:hypothetical protein